MAQDSHRARVHINGIDSLDPFVSLPVGDGERLFKVRLVAEVLVAQVDPSSRVVVYQRAEHEVKVGTARVESCLPSESGQESKWL